MMIVLKATPSSPEPVARPAPVDRALLARMRLVACACRAGARVDASCNCTGSGAGTRPCLGALVAFAPQATGRHLTFYRPGEPEISFDESWVLALIEAAGRGDDDSLHFLTIRHVVPSSRARIVFLAHGVAEARVSGFEGTANGVENAMHGQVDAALK